MNHLDTHDRFDALVRDALVEDADRAPELPEEWPGATVSAVSPNASRTARWRIVTAAAAATLLLAGALALVARERSESTPAAPSAWVPDGTEFPSTDHGPATIVHDGPVVAALSRQVEVDGHPPMVVTRSLTYMGGDTATEQACTWGGGGGGCRPDWNTSTWSTSITSSVDNGEADFDLWVVEGLPRSAAFVTSTVGDETFWQRPVMGFAAFPHAPGSEHTVIAYDIDGVEVGRYGPDEEAAQAFTGPRPHIADISAGDLNRLAELTADEMRACLTSRGGVLSGDVATFAEGVDQTAVWSDCVADVKEIVRAAVAELDARFYDPASERPLHPDPAFHFGD